MPITAGVIGCGNISRFHFSGLEKAGARVKWVCDLNEAAARPWADRFGARYTADYQDLIVDAEVNLVDVTAHSSVHKEICLAAIAAGKPVVCEKTLAVNADDALEIVRAAEAAGTIFYTSYMKRFIPAMEQARALLPSLGTITSTYLRAYQPWGDLWDRVPADHWLAPGPEAVSWSAAAATSWTWWASSWGAPGGSGRACTGPKVWISMCRRRRCWRPITGSCTSRPWLTR